MSPTLVLDERGAVRAALGSPGGRRILSYVLRALVAHLDGGRPLHEVLAEPNWALLPTKDGGFRVEVEREPLWAGDPYPPGLLAGLVGLGHPVEEVSSVNSGLHGIEWTEQGWRSAVDPRREGAARAP
jgi:gamma-glutamyltranspeptidase/glutathione hydrolase